MERFRIIFSRKYVNSGTLAPRAVSISCLSILQVLTLFVSVLSVLRFTYVTVLLSSIRFVWICICILAQSFVSLSSYGKQRTSRFLSAHRIQASYGIVTISHIVAFHPKERVFTVQPPERDSTIIDPFTADNPEM